MNGLVAVEGFGDGKALFPISFVKFFAEYARFRLPRPNRPWPGGKICLTNRKNGNSPHSNPSTATSLILFLVKNLRKAVQMYVCINHRPNGNFRLKSKILAAVKEG
jgi:hypothetical protein